jgi:hypothetical protein
MHMLGVAAVCVALSMCASCLSCCKVPCGACLFSVVLQVIYEDGDVAKMWMGVERTRLLITAGEELQRPDAATLQQLANRCARHVLKALLACAAASQ